MQCELDDAAIQADYKAGLSIGTIARRNGVANDTIGRRLRLAGIPIRVLQKRFSNETVQEIRRLHASGWGQRALARRYGMTQSAMRKIILGESYPHVPAES